MSPTRTLLIRPNSKAINYPKLGKDLAAIAPPIWMALRAAELVRKHQHIGVIDAEVQPFDIEQTKAERVEIFPSGNHSSAYIQQKEGIDNLAEEFRKRTREVKIWEHIPEFDFEQSPLWDYFPMGKYRAHNWHCWGKIPRSPYGQVCSSYGCPYKCTFCCINDFYRTGFKERNLESVVTEIVTLRKRFGIKNIKFIDEMFLFRQRRIEELCDRLIAEKLDDLNIWAYAKVDIIPKFLPKLKKAGFRWLGIGIESGDETIRRTISKGKFTNQQIKEELKRIRDTGINVSGAFIFGFMDDTLETMQKTLDFAKELNLEQANFHSMMCYPGSSDYEEAKKLGWELPQNWREYSQYSYECFPIRTKCLSNVEVLRFRDNAFHEYYTSEKYLSMIKEKFDQATADEILEMTKVRLRRKLYEENRE